MNKLLTEMTPLDWVIIIMGVFAYLPLIRAMLKDKEHCAGQNFYTWILWFFLDVILLIVTILEKGNPISLFVFVPASCLATIISFKYRTKMPNFEKWMSVLVFLCIIIWLTSDEYYAIIFATISQVIAGLPILKDTWKKPEKFITTFFPLFLFLIVHSLMLLNKPELSVKNSLFSGVMLIFTIITMLPIFIEMKRQQKNKNSLKSSGD